MNDQEINTHLRHCFQGEYEDSCKYGDKDCPARFRYKLTKDDQELGNIVEITKIINADWIKWTEKIFCKQLSSHLLRPEPPFHDETDCLLCKWQKRKKEILYES